MRDRAVLAAVALVCATNLGALGVGALNRSSAESTVTLTERELRLVHPAASITQLRLNWAQPSPLAFGADAAGRAGFDTSVDPSAPGGDTHYRRQLQRDAYVALEYDGDAWAGYRDTVLRRQPPAINALTPRQIQEQRASIDQVVAGHSRLFAVGMDADPLRLRAQFPERSRHLIARARVSVSVEGDPRGIVAHVVQLMPGEINVPRPFSVTLRDLTQAAAYGYSDTLVHQPRFAAEVKYGRRYEPWIADVRPLRP
jgi:hypothetical protein